MGDEDLASLVKILVGLKVYVVWYDDPYDYVMGSDGEEIWVQHKILEGIFASKKKAEEYIERVKGARAPEDYNVEEETLQ
jgi:hypothetical protein